MTRDILAKLDRIANALERLAPHPPKQQGLQDADAFVWSGQLGSLLPIKTVSYTDGALLKGVAAQYAQVLSNTQRFAQGFSANNVMLWGARGMGKSSIVKAVHAQINAQQPHSLAIIEILSDDLTSLPQLMQLLRTQQRRCIIFCDDLSFETQDIHYKLLKSALDGGLAGRPSQVLFYATSNRRHLMPRDIIENEAGTAIDPKEVVEEKVSLSDRFGLWIGLHGCDQSTYLEMVDAYASAQDLHMSQQDLHREALIWSLERGGRSGRVAKQFIDSLDTSNAHIDTAKE